MKRVLFLLCVVLICNTELSAQIKSERELVRDVLLQLDSISKAAIGKELCDFKSSTLDGRVISNKDLKGKITFVDLWFETCSPCIAEMGDFIELYGKLKDNKDFQFFSFTVDSPETAKKAVEKYNIPYIVCPISREDAYRMNMNTGFPTKIIINKDGKITFFKTGGSKKQEIKEIEDKIKQLL